MPLSRVRKSTLMKLLLRYYTPTNGKILIDGLDIKDLDLSFLRNNITYIGQNESLFTGSILQNLELVDNNKESIDKVCSITLLDSFMTKNSIDYNYIIEESGTNLSGGERQRVILARTFLKKSNIYILDESFSEIDKDSEKIILNNIFKKYKDKTIIVISHKSDNNDIYDRIIDLEKLDYGY